MRAPAKLVLGALVACALPAAAQQTLSRPAITAPPAATAPRTVTGLPKIELAKSSVEISTKENAGIGFVRDAATNAVLCSAQQTCTQFVPAGATLTLKAEAANGQTFMGWSGACTGTSTCTLTYSAQPQTVSARFYAPLPQKLVDNGCSRFLGREDEANCPTYAAHTWCLGVLDKSVVKVCVLAGYPELSARVETARYDLPEILTQHGCTKTGASAYDCATPADFHMCVSLRNGGEVNACRKTPEGLPPAPQAYIKSGGASCGCASAQCKLACTMDTTLRSTINDIVSATSAASPLEQLAACYDLTDPQKPGQALAQILNATADAIASPGAAVDKSSFAAAIRNACYNRLLVPTRF